MNTAVAYAPNRYHRVQMNTVSLNYAPTKRCACSSLKGVPLHCIIFRTATDPCMGSGHILVYAFDVLMQIYESYGYTQRDAARSILKNNIFGLDIDKRAYQLAYFSIMMKARCYNRRILTEKIEPNLCFVQNSTSLSEPALEKMGNCKNITQQLISDFEYAAEYGSVTTGTLSEDDLKTISNQVEYIEEHMNEGDLIDVMACNEVLSNFVPLLKQAILLIQKYDIVVTNPPYMPVSNAENKLNEYVKKNYPDSKTDLFAVFIERCQKMLKANGYQAMITMHSWMFLNSYEKLREKMLLNDTINMVHLGARAFEEIGGEVVQTTAFVRRKNNTPAYKGVYCRLIEPTTQQGKEDMFFAGKNRFKTEQSNFSKIPGNPVAYWVGKQVLKAFEGFLLSDYGYPKQGFATGDNNTFLRFWQEVDMTKIGFEMENREVANQSGKKWFPCNKGGSFRRWYGNNNYLANWQADGKEMTEFKGSVIRNPQYYFKQGITWSSLTSGKLSMRYSPKGFLFESKGSVCFMKNEDNLWYILGLMNTEIVSNMLSVLSPTLDYHEGPISRVPIIISDPKEQIEIIVKQNVEICKNDWDSYETSWDFQKHPLI